MSLDRGHRGGECSPKLNSLIRAIQDCTLILHGSPQHFKVIPNWNTSYVVMHFNDVS